MKNMLPLHGFNSGGTLLNCRILTYRSEEARQLDVPGENYIGVVTTEKISRWCFASKEPADPEPGMLWIAVGSKSVAALNVLKRNSLYLYPLYAKQFVDDGWVYVDVKSGKDGVWIDWTTDILLYSKGSEIVPLTLNNASKETSYLRLSLPKNGNATITSDPLTLNCHSKVSVAYSNLTGEGSFAGGLRIKIVDLEKTEVKASGRITAESGTVELDISDLSLAGDYIVEVFANNTSSSYSGSCRVSEIKALR